MPDRLSNTSPPPLNNGNQDTEAHRDCTGCGETSHILLPLADLLKAVASTLQTHPGHAHAESQPGAETDSTQNTNAETSGAEPTWLDKGKPSLPLSSEQPPHSAGGNELHSWLNTLQPSQPFADLSKGNSNPIDISPAATDQERTDERRSQTATDRSNHASSNQTALDETADSHSAASASTSTSTPAAASASSADTSSHATEPEGFSSKENSALDESDDDGSSDQPETDDASSISLLAETSDPENLNQSDSTSANQKPDNRTAKNAKLTSSLFPFLGYKNHRQSDQRSAEDNSGEDDEDEDSWNTDPAVQPRIRFRNWRGLDGIAVMLFGVVFPALMLAGTCTAIPKRLTLVLLNHPVELLAELALLALIPLTNFALWSALRRDDMRLSLTRGLSLGSAMVTALIVAGTSFAALLNGNGSSLASEIGTSFEAGFTWLSALAFMAASASGYILYKYLKARDFVESRRLVIAYTMIGALLSSFTVLGAEGKSWYVRMSERMAVSNKAAERVQGLAQLQPFYPERELRMECTDSRAAGLAGLFFPIKPSAEQELYFRLTGKPFSFHDENNDLATMPDDYVSRHAVGDPIPGLAMVRSEMSAAVHPQILTSSVDWTFVYRNESNSSQEARSEIGLPPGAVITGMTEWVNGDQVHGTFTATGKAQMDSTMDASSSPATIIDLGHNRALLRCSSVQPDAELKVAMKMIVPLSPDAPQTASMLLPKLIAQNFSLEDENGVKLYSPLKLNSGFSDLHAATSGGGVQTLIGQLPGKRLESAEVIVEVARPVSTATSIVVLDKLAVTLAQEDQKRLNELRRRTHHNSMHITPLPQQLTVIVDGRQGIKQQLDQLAGEFNQRRDERGLRPIIKTVKPKYVFQSIYKVKSPAPKQLVIVVDGSETMKEHASELKKALSAVPQNFPVKLMIASQDNPKLTKEVSLSQGLSNLKEANFAGGQNNLKSVIDAAEDAGTVKGSAVLWIHGPQPVSNSEIYITTPYAAQPSLYELPIDSGEIDTNEFFKNHNDIGSFMQVSHNATLSKDIACFFSKWQPDSADYAVALSEGDEKSAGALELPATEAQEVLQLNAYKNSMALLAGRRPREAARIAVAYGILTPVSCVLIEREAAAAVQVAQNQPVAIPSPAAGDEFTSGGSQGAAPRLQGATNGSIGPQGSDATYVTGLNTSGTVRVNNLANLEALLNLIANGCEICGVIGGLIVLLSGFTSSEAHKVRGSKLARRVAIGVALIAFGLAVPGCINWLVASARDANLFS